MNGTGYDSYWLLSYYAAIDFLAANEPHLLDAFREETSIFRVPGDFRERLIPDLFSASQREEMRALIQSLPDQQLERHEFLTFGRLVVHDHPFFNALQTEICDVVSDTVGERVEPSYNFLSLYNNLGICRPHMDAPLAKWTVDFCIDQSGDWPIHFSPVVPWPTVTELRNWGYAFKPQVSFEARTLQPGDAVVFGGCSQWHYRDRMPQRPTENFCHLVFFHFVPAGAHRLAEPGEWADYFGVPGLNDVVTPSDG